MWWWWLFQGAFTGYWWIPLAKGQYFGAFLVVCLNRLWNKHLSCQWFWMPWHSCGPCGTIGCLIHGIPWLVLDAKYMVVNLVLVIDGWSISCEITLRWLSLDLTDDKSSLVQIMTWCCQATRHYPNQCCSHVCHRIVSLGQNELISKNNFTPLSRYHTKWALTHSCLSVTAITCHWTCNSFEHLQESI